MSKSGQLHQVLRCVHCLARLQRARYASWTKSLLRKPQNGGCRLRLALGSTSIAPGRDVTSSAASSCSTRYKQARSRKIRTFPNLRSPSMFKNFGCFYPLPAEAHVPFTSDRCLNARATPRLPFIPRARTSNLDCGGDHLVNAFSHRKARYFFHIVRLCVPPETDVIASGLVTLDLAYLCTRSGQYL